MNKKLLCTTFAVGLLSLACSAVWAHGRDHDDDDSVRRETRFGPIVGVDNSRRDGTLAWKGVPFAKAPVGNLRWRPPVDPDSWKRPRQAREFGNACVQN